MTTPESKRLLPAVCQGGATSDRGGHKYATEVSKKKKKVRPPWTPPMTSPDEEDGPSEFSAYFEHPKDRWLTVGALNAREGYLTRATGIPASVWKREARKSEKNIKFMPRSARGKDEHL